MKPFKLLSLAAALLTSFAHAALPDSDQQAIDRYGEQIYRNSRAVGMVMVVIDKNQAAQRFYGQTRPGSRTLPNADSLLRIASISKTMTGEVLASLAMQQRVRLEDPLQKFAPQGVALPADKSGKPITLLNLATHTSGFPREMPGAKPQDTPVFVWPTQQQRWQWLSSTRSSFSPGLRAQYSNLAFDFLADALAAATGRPYASLLNEKITAPLGMRDTTLTPSPEQCARLMEGYGASPCLDTRAAGGSGGIYSTPRDMQRWLQDLVHPQNEARRELRDRMFHTYFKRDELRSLRGMDVAGKADELGLGWIRMEATPNAPEIIQKTAGGGGFIGYVALAPKHDVAVWVGLTRTGGTHYQSMSGGVNKLVTTLSGYQPVETPAPVRSHVRAKPVKAKAHAATAKSHAKRKAPAKAKPSTKPAHRHAHAKKAK
ncbi:D-alanyl-D-alanine-carboxypeptidase/endopeptidase AmpH [Chromobacterium paludis]|uniref:D-alanyl-D-alanine-carboxypeptidase/endopeptidase AmpH n=1 Tax=Chromobacterium paludis TaxID=2605945 RepID=A0A5C1DEN7_9NEIS|nr:D-alanyl-D-alanine-carboxypeptidase/endopeptidase AmpH [Chromobacterium paludis]QEL55096.1 D-alanyl-D-alanine-carboxypeptidase/endopeptidase AmpH [Chromobacterium paludis]